MNCTVDSYKTFMDMAIQLLSITIQNPVWSVTNFHALKLPFQDEYNVQFLKGFISCNGLYCADHWYNHNAKLIATGF